MGQSRLKVGSCSHIDSNEGVAWISMLALVGQRRRSDDTIYHRVWCICSGGAPIVNGYETTDYPSVGVFYMCSDAGSRIVGNAREHCYQDGWQRLLIVSKMGIKWKFYFIIGFHGTTT